MATQAHYLKKFGPKMFNTPKSTAKGWVEGIGTLAPEQQKSLWRKIKKKYY